MTMDRNERLATLETRNLNNISKRVTKNVIDAYIGLKVAANPVDIRKASLAKRYDAIRNALFLKYACIDYEGASWAYRDRKVKGNI